MRSAVPLQAAPAGMRRKLELRYAGKPLADPQVLTVQLFSRSRKDIPNDAYNDGQSLRLDMGARIVEILQITSIPETLPAPSVTADGTALAIGPSLIGKRQEIAITVLADGRMPSLTCRSPLIDVQVEEVTDERLDVPALAETMGPCWGRCSYSFLRPTRPGGTRGSAREAVGPRYARSAMTLLSMEAALD
jgi:hypothetical protein